MLLVQQLIVDACDNCVQKWLLPIIFVFLVDYHSTKCENKREICFSLNYCACFLQFEGASVHSRKTKMHIFEIELQAGFSLRKQIIDRSLRLTTQVCMWLIVTQYLWISRDSDGLLSYYWNLVLNFIKSDYKSLAKEIHQIQINHSAVSYGRHLHGWSLHGKLTVSVLYVSGMLWFISAVR